MRRQARICSLQILYLLDIHRHLSPKCGTFPQIQASLERYWSGFDVEEPVDRPFADRLVEGVVNHLPWIDQKLSEVSYHWRLERMDKVDLNLLRLAAYEILCCPDIPRAASINEAVEIAKSFGGSASPGFINGLLDHLVS